jgi:hypothetical protein
VSFGKYPNTLAFVAMMHSLLFWFEAINVLQNKNGLDTTKKPLRKTYWFTPPFKMGRPSPKERGRAAI